MEAKKALERDWSSLPPELLNLIAKNLREISDFVRFRVVCTAWRFSTPITDIPPQFPWILENHRYPDEPPMRFYSTTSNKMYTIHAPKYLGKRFMGSSQGYMFTELCQDSPAQHICQFAILNPLNNHEIPLPACDFVLHSYFYLIGPQQYQIGEYVVCVGGSKLAFCCLGQDNWCEFKRLNFDIDFEFFHLKGMIFIVDENTGVIKVTDLTTGTLAYVIPPVEDYMMESDYYLVDASGDILIVLRRYDDSPDSYDDDSYNIEFDVHRLELSGSSSPCWVKVKNIGNQALFIDSDDGFALEASDFAGIKANCIYYIEYDYYVKRIDIETGNWKLQCPFNKPERWFIPNLQHLQAR